MAPLHEAINAEFAYAVEGDGSDSRTVYRGQVDPEWTVFKVPHGGYILGLILQSVIEHQTGTPYPDLIHVTAHFLRSAAVGPFEVHIRTIKTGKGFKNLTATFTQRNQDVILTHVICGTLEHEPPPPLGRASQTVSPPSPYAVQIPMHTHPSKAHVPPPLPRWTYKQRIKAGRDDVYESRTRAAPGVGGCEWGEYITLTGEDERLSAPMLAFFADSHLMLPVLLPLPSPDIWVPTMVMTLEFKFPIPKPSNTRCAQRTVAVYSRGKFVNDPDMRHDTYVEVWTAPSDVGEGSEEEGWKVHQRCLAVGTQMALIVPGNVNRKRGTEGGKLETDVKTKL